MRIDPTKLEKFLKNNPTKQNVAALAAINKPSKSTISDSMTEKVKSNKDKRDVASTDLPDWLHNLVFKNSDVLYCLKTKKKSDCPHISSFVGLAKRPSMYKGKQEHYLQVALFLMAKKHLPELYEHMFSVPNGGMRSSGVAGMMKAEGQKGGYPDIAVDFARGGYFGYRLEVKTERGVIRDGQVEWACRLNRQNYKTEVGYGFSECWSMLKEYWSLEPTVIGN